MSCQVSLEECLTGIGRSGIVIGVNRAPIRRHLAEARRAADLTQTELAERLGCDQTRISKIESGKVRVTTETITEIAHAIGAKPMDLIAGYFESQSDETEAVAS